MIELAAADGPIARLCIRRAARRNAFTVAMWTRLRALCDELAAAHPAPRALLLEGEPGAFCAGADLDELTQQLSDPAALAANHAAVTQAQAALAALPLPTIAVIDGPCVGGGVGLAAACDFRLGSTRARFAVTPARLGLLYSLEDTRRLVHLLGAQRTRRLLMRGETVDADTALVWGLLDEVLAPTELAPRAQACAAELAALSRTSMAGIKATLAHLRGDDDGDAAADPAAGRHAAERRLHARFLQAFDGPDFAEGAAAFLHKRSPRFS